MESEGKRGKAAGGPLSNELVQINQVQWTWSVFLFSFTLAADSALWL